MKNNRREIMIAQVKIEAKNLRKHATKDELQKLDFEKLNPIKPTLCIYGQVTGDCFSDRAQELISKCASRIYKGESVDSCRVNGSAKDAKRGRHWGNEHWSPIEVFISQRYNADNEIQAESQKIENAKLISYLKGETKTLNIK